jgi:hypothetical protein
MIRWRNKMNVGGCWVFGRPDDIFIENDILYRRIYETEQTYRDERIMTKEEFLLCMKEWYKNE